MRRVVFAFCISIIACGGTAARQPGTASAADPTKAHPIRLHRHPHVGDRVRVVLDEADDNSSVMHLASNGKEISKDHQTRHAHLEGVMTTTALDERQDEIHGTVDVTTLTVDDVVLLKNKQIDVTKALKPEDAKLLVDGAPVSPELRTVLKDLLSLRVGGPSDDDVFGTKQPQMVGAHWPINGELARADLASDAQMGAAKVSGDTTFAGIKRVNDVDALDLKAALQIDGITFPVGQPGATCEPGVAKGTMSKVVPVDENRGVIESHTSLEINVRIHVPTPQGDDIVGDIRVTSHHDEHFAPL